MRVAHVSPRHAGQTLHFLRHLLEMALAMILGMVAGGAVFVVSMGVTVDEAITRYPVAFTLVMAFSMTMPMIAWMRHRGHAWRSSSEMAAAMVVPALLLICLSLADVITGPICGFYCASSLIAMVAVMLYRRSEYGAGHTHG